MFTGIIQAVGTITRLEPQGVDVRLRIETGTLSLTDVQVGDSIAVNGVCLTAVQLLDNGFWADVSGETLQVTTLSAAQAGDRVNLEKALTPTTRLGGHLVSGHVDGIGEIIDRRAEGRSYRFRVRAPDELARYIAKKGSVCIDGVSLTVNDIDGSMFGLNIVPHTLHETTFADYSVGTRVNVEVDVVARYLERLLLGDAAARPGSQGITLDFLREHGFVRS